MDGVSHAGTAGVGWVVARPNPSQELRLRAGLRAQVFPGTELEDAGGTTHLLEGRLLAGRIGLEMRAPGPAEEALWSR
jgi:hypothetical protein